MQVVKLSPALLQKIKDNVCVAIESDADGKRVTDVKDNACLRGPEYAKKELLNPTRTLTTTIA